MSNDAIRTRLPGKADTVTSGEAARDADDRFSRIPSFQLVELPNQDYTEPLFVRMTKPPKIVVCGAKLASDPDVAVVGFNAGVEFTWTGSGINVRKIGGLTAGNGLRYNFVFLGVG